MYIEFSLVDDVVDGSDEGEMSVVNGRCDAYNIVVVVV